MSQGFIEATLRGFTAAISKALVSETAASQPGLLQTLDPRVRVLGLFTLVAAVVLSRRISVIAGLFAIAVLMATASRVRVVVLAKRVWLIVLGFSGLIALPAVFVTPGQPIFRMPWLPLAVTAQGLRGATRLVLRAETAATLTTVLALSTPWAHLLKALRSLHLPAEVVTMLAMTHRYVFLLVETAGQMFESRQSRTVGALPGREQRRMAARTAGVLLTKSIELSHQVFLAMRSRGFRGEVPLLQDLRMKAHDYLGLMVLVLIAGVAVWIGR
ncbi:MAG TPA: cobalt ECF transporter T component CbiQ [Terriglobales bacterium]|nr:cobalt ECF transporter T component CbiQ [Terriglobales bacterium]